MDAEEKLKIVFKLPLFAIDNMHSTYFTYYSIPNLKWQMPSRIITNNFFCSNNVNLYVKEAIA